MDKEHLKRLYRAWSQKRGKYIIKPTDFPEHFLVRFSKNGKLLLEYIYCHLSEKYGLDHLHRKNKRNLYVINDYLKGKSQTLSVKTLRTVKWYIKHYSLDFNFDLIEKEAILIKSGKGNHSVLKAKFPLDLRDPLFAYILGLSFDSYLGSFCFTNTNNTLLNLAETKFNSFGFTCKVRDKRDNMKEISVGKIASQIIKLAGFEISTKQIDSNNPLPKWVFEETNISFLGNFLAALIDTEGNVYRRVIRISQNNRHKFDDSNLKIENMKILPVCNTTFIYQISQKENPGIVKKIREDPPLILISVQHLLENIGVNSRLNLEKIYLKRNLDLCSSWNLIVHGKNNMESIYNLIRYTSVKGHKLKELLGKYKNSSCGRNQRIPNFITTISDIGKCRTAFTSKDIVSETRRKFKTVVSDLEYMRSKNIIECVGKEGRFKKWILITN
ncbi:MAG: hypothetical protein ABID38_01645 [Candidatus Diapherotrites archaeon]